MFNQTLRTYKQSINLRPQTELVMFFKDLLLQWQHVCGDNKGPYATPELHLQFALMSAQDAPEWV